MSARTHTPLATHYTVSEISLIISLDLFLSIELLPSLLLININSSHPVSQRISCSERLIDALCVCVRMHTTC